MTVEFARGKAYVIDRGKPKLRAGQGMLAGLDVVIKHFVGAFTKKLETPSETTGVFTVQYPEERLALPEAFRNFPILLYDDATGHELCTSDHPSMTVDKVGLDRPVSYYEAIAPSFWAEVKDSAYKNLQGNMKRRSGTIGIAPQVAGKVKKAAPAAARPAAAAAPTAATRPAAPVAAVGTNMSAEKRARLEAIRAAKAGGGAAPAPVVEAVSMDDGEAAEAAPVAVATARPAASGSASNALSTGLPFSADNLLGGVPENTAMAEDKLDRLRSIRSGNIAKPG